MPKTSRGGGASAAVAADNAATATAPQPTNQPVAQNGNSNNAVAAQAEPSNNSSSVTEGVSVGFYKTKNSDGTLSDPLGEDDTVTTNQTLYGQIDITFVDGERPTVDRPSVSYQLPSNIKVAAQTMPLLDNGRQVGETVIDENGLVTLKYTDMGYVTAEVKDAKFKFSFTLDGDPKGDGGEEKIKFTGSSETTIKTKDGDVSASKFGGNISESWNGPKYDAESNTYTWTIKVSPETYATDLVVSDTIGSNLEFVKDSFKLVDEKGNTVSGTCNVAFEGDSNANINLGSLPGGTYYVQYKTTVKQSALDSLGNNEELTNVGNTAHWSWGSADNRKSDNGNGVSSNPQQTKYSMVSKSADASESTNEKIKWVVKLNNGDIKADMDGYHFIDQVGDDQDFILADGFVVMVDGKQILMEGSAQDQKKLEFYLPNGIGKQQVEIVYYTKMKDPSSKDSVSNTAKITVDDQLRPDGEGTGTYNPKDNDTYIEKALAGSIDPDAYDGKASWTSTINFGAMSKSTDPTSIKFKDYFSSLPENTKVRLDGDVAVASGDIRLEEGIDYTITKSTDEVGCWYPSLFEIIFKNSEVVRGLLGSSDAKVTISYSTVTTQVDGVYPAGRYANKSSVQTNKVNEKTAEASYEISHDQETPSVKKECAKVSWNAEKKSWIVDWEVYINCYEPNSWTHQGVKDLKGQDVVVTDQLPEGMTYVEGSNQYWLMPNNGYKEGGYNPALKDENPVEDAESSRITFTLKTDSVVNESGSWIGYVYFKYQTEVKSSDVPFGDSKKFANIASAKSGDIEFPSGSDTVEIENKVLSKKGDQAGDDPLVTYTIDVNENGLTLNGGKDLVLSDVMDPSCKYSGGLEALNLKDSTPLDQTKWSKSFTTVKNEKDGSFSTKMTLTLPDATPLRIVYKVSPLGSLGEIVSLKNSCTLDGGSSWPAEARGDFKVIAASSETSNTTYGIEINKYNAALESRLQGAEFTLYKVDSFGADDVPVLEEVDSKTTGEDGKVSFGDKTDPLKSNTLYCFKETKAPKGYKISQQDPIYFVLKGTDENAFKRVVEDATSHKAKPETLTSSFDVTDEEDNSPVGSAVLSMKKTVNGAAPAEGQSFEFKLSAVTAGAPMPDGSGNVVSTSGSDAEKSFGEISFDAPGTYTYKIEEASAAPDDGNVWSMAAPVYAQVAVGEAENGKLPTSVKYFSDEDCKQELSGDKAVFSNTYVIPTSASLAAKKTFEGGTLENRQFSFELKQTSAPEGVSFDKRTASNDANGDVSFGPIEYDKAGTYEYEISEVVPEGTVGNVKDGIAYDSAKHTAKVEVSDGGQGKLAAKVTYDDKSETPTFANQYSASGDLVLSVYKTVNGGTSDKPGEKFSFQLFAADGDGNAQGNAIGSLETEMGKKAYFDSLHITKEGTYHYVIKEDGHNGNGWTAAPDVEVKVVAKDNGKGALSFEVEYSNANADKDAALFNNKYEQASGEFQLGLVKTVNGSAPAAGQSFEFSAVPTEDSDEGAPGFQNVTTDKNGSAVFAVTKLSDKDAGKTYVYCIHEVSNPQSDLGVWKKADDVIATVKVGSRGIDNKLPVMVTYSANAGGSELYEGAAKFNNVYREIGGSFQLALVKSVDGKALDRSFDFKAEAVGQNAGSAPKLEYDTASSDAGTGKASFGTAKLTAANKGQRYTYKISETSNLSAAWAKAADVYAHVAVSEGLNDDGDLTATVTYSADEQGTSPYTGAAEFVNKYTQASGGFHLQVEKTVNGNAPAAGQSFKFKASSTDAGASELGEVTTDEAGKAMFTFDGLNDSFEGKEFTYTISEEFQDGNGWTKAADVKAKVAVGQRGTDNKFHPTVTYQQAGSDEWVPGSAKFNNTYEATGSAVLSVKKLVNGGGDDPTGSAFTFQLKQQDGKVLSEATAKAGETVSFEPIDYTLADAGKVFTYTISEVGGNDGAWFAAKDVTATVKVSDNGNGTLATKVSYSNAAADDQAAALFDNAYAPASATLQVKKLVNGAEPADGQRFEFELSRDASDLASANAPLPEEATAATVGSAPASFGAIEFTEPGEYRYTIHETSDMGEGWTNAPDVTATVKVVRDEQARTLKVESVDYGEHAYGEGDQQMALFNNKYEQPKQPGEDTPKGETPQQPDGNTPSDQPKPSADSGASSGVKTGDSLALVGGGVALVAIVAAVAAWFAFRRKRD